MRPEDIIEERKRQQEFRQKIWESNPENKMRQEEERKLREQQRTQGKIFDPFVKNWLDAEIVAARVALVIGMILTALIKGQIVIWIILYIAYRGRIKKVKQDAMEADMRRL